MYTYILCKNWQERKDGRVITTNYNMNKFKDLDSFLKELYKNEEITEDELNEIVTDYYA